MSLQKIVDEAMKLSIANRRNKELRDDAVSVSRSVLVYFFIFYIIYFILYIIYFYFVVSSLLLLLRLNIVSWDTGFFSRE